MDGETSPQWQALQAIPAKWGNPDPQYISHLPRKTKEGRTIQLDYMDHAQIRAALTAEDAGWTWEPMAYGDDGLPAIKIVNGNANLWIWLTVHGKRQPGVGNCAAGKEDVLKELIGDALRNGAMTFGFALSLWTKQAQLAGAEAMPAEMLPPEGPVTDEQPPAGMDHAEGVARPAERLREALKERANQLPPADRGTLRASIELQHLSWNRDQDLAQIELLIRAAEEPLQTQGEPE